MPISVPKSNVIYSCGFWNCEDRKEAGTITRLKMIHDRGRFEDTIDIFDANLGPKTQREMKIWLLELRILKRN